MRQEALLLTKGELSQQTKNAVKVLRFFGVPSRTLDVVDFFRSLDQRKQNQLRLICSAEVLLSILDCLACNANRIQLWRTLLHSAFVYGENNPEVLTKLLQRLSGQDAVCVGPVRGNGEAFVVSQEAYDLCGPMAGVTISSAVISGSDVCFVLKNTDSRVSNIISIGSGAVFPTIEYEGVPVFLSTSSVLDVDAPLPTGIFDIREHAISALPVILYIRWAFAQSCWRPAENTACLVIDDPLLRPTHGFVDFAQLLSLMKAHRFSASVAFIPWNWRRSVPATVQLFRDNPEVYSLSVHGCDHVRGEFGSPNRQFLYHKTLQAIQRMSEHQSRTNIPYDRVMVFPQGVFSTAAITALKRADFLAAVNNDTLPVDLQRAPVTIADFWDVAMMKYGGFPIFTRRNPREGIENFAFDILLGKPAIIVIHHDFCQDRYGNLVGLISGLNRLNCSLRWRSLGEIVRRSYRQRELTTASVKVEMYGKELLLENRSTTPKRYLIHRREDEPHTINHIRIEQLDLAWTASDGCVTFETQLSPGEKKLVQLQYRQPETDGASDESVSYRASAMLRRYLCEFRDNYVQTGRHRLSKLLHGRSNRYSGASSLL